MPDTPLSKFDIGQMSRAEQEGSPTMPDTYVHPRLGTMCLKGCDDPNCANGHAGSPTMPDTPTTLTLRTAIANIHTNTGWQGCVRRGRWQEPGSFVTVARCDHHHRTITAAERCADKLVVPPEEPHDD